MAYTIDVNINDFNTADDCHYVIDVIKKTYDKEDRFYLLVSGCYEDPNEKVSVSDKRSNDLSYQGLLDHISKLHLVLEKIKEDN